MALREYELTVIVRSNVAADVLDTMIAQHTAAITKPGGTVLHAIQLGKRALAYPIEKEQRGTYLYYDFVADGEVVKTLEQSCRHDEQILRYLTVMINAQPDIAARRTQHDEDLKRLEQYLGATLTKAPDQGAASPGSATV